MSQSWKHKHTWANLDISIWLTIKLDQMIFMLVEQNFTWKTFLEISENFLENFLTNPVTDLFNCTSLPIADTHHKFSQDHYNSFAVVYLFNSTHPLLFLQQFLCFEAICWRAGCLCKTKKLMYRQGCRNIVISIVGCSTNLVYIHASSYLPVNMKIIFCQFNTQNRADDL